MSDFIANMSGYNDLKPFRFWCQKVLPLVYDDSLSYYELLCKVVDYLNNTMEDVTILGDAFTALQNYVNTYFDNLDVTTEIDRKLDEMFADGSIGMIIENQLAVINARIDEIASLPSGSTTGDAELADIRVGVNGITYANAGDAVRSQIINAKDTIPDIKYLPVNELENTDIYFLDGRYRYVTNTKRLSFSNAPITLRKGDIIRCNLQTRITCVDDPTIYTLFSNDSSVKNTRVSVTGRYYILIRDDDVEDIAVADIEYLYVERVKVEGFIYGYYETLNTLNPVYVFPDENWICCEKGIPVKAGMELELPNGRFVASFVYTDQTYEYFGYCNGIIKAQKDGLMYVIIDVNYADAFFSGVKGQWWYGTTTDEHTVSYSNTRITGKKQNLTYLNENGMNLAFHVHGVDSSWLNQLYALEGGEGTWTVRNTDNSAISVPKIKQYETSLVFPNIYAHRGFKPFAPENTLAALICAKGVGFGGTEFDVRFTSDGVPVLLHDPTINRTARTKQWEAVSDTIYVEQETYQNLIDNYYFDGDMIAKQNIPTLEEYIIMSKGLGMKCLLEIAYQSLTPYTREQVEEIVKTVERCSYLENTVFISFDADYLLYASDYNSDCEIGYITSTMSDAYITNTLRLKADYPKLGLSYAGNDDELSLKCINNGIRLYNNFGAAGTTKFRGEVLLTDSYPPRFRA